MAGAKRPLRLRVTGGPEPRTFVVCDAETGEQYTNIEMVEVAFNIEGATATVTLHDAVLLDVQLSPGGVAVVMPPLREAS